MNRDEERYNWLKVLVLIFVFLSCCYCIDSTGEEVTPPEKNVIQLQPGAVEAVATVDLTKIAVGDPEVADVKVLNQQEILVTAKKLGVTNLIIWDKRGQVTYNIEIISKEVIDIAQTIRGLLAENEIEGISVRPAPPEGKIYLSGQVKTKERLRQINDLLRPFQDKIVNIIVLKEPQPMVKVEVEVLEISRDDDKRFGVDWSTIQTITGTEGTPPVTGRMREMFKLADIQRSAFELVVNALITEGRGRLLARPNLVTLDNQSAKFLVGGEIPIAVKQQVDEPPSIEWKEYGITLTVTPRVTEEQDVIIKVNAEVSELGSRTFVYSGNEIPEILTRSLKAQVKLKEGQTLLLAGMFRDKDTVTISRVPLLSMIPILGKLFVYEAFDREKKELVIALTPTIIPTEEEKEEEEVAEASAEEADKLETEREQTEPSEAEVVADLKSELTRYAGLVQRQIARDIIYPRSFWWGKREGSVEVTLSISSPGNLDAAKVTKSSGIKELDRAALQAVNKQKTFPPLPESYKEEVLYLTLPISYEK